jgi:hypothetical protein
VAGMDARFLRNVLLKGLALFVLANLIFAAWPVSNLGTFSLYNHLFRGRLRLPFGEDSARAYNLSLFDLDAMFESHVISAAPKPADEYRVIALGDSSIWGTLLRPEETLAGRLDAEYLNACDGRRIRVYNLGYPTLSLTKDLMILDYTLRYKPDLIIWGVTLEAFPLDKQLSTPLVANNAARIDSLLRHYHLPFDRSDRALVRPAFSERTIIGQRRALADLFRLQMYGVMWSATGIDQTYPDDYQPAQTDLDPDESFHDMQPPQLDETQLAFDVLEAGLRAAGDIPVIILNEPMLVSSGKNSNIRYNFFYPRWAYDQYRQQMAARAASAHWTYLDLWNLVPADQFTNSAIHLTPAGEALLAERIRQAISQKSCSQ